MRQTADILSGKAAMQIRYLEAIQNMASGGNVKVVFLAEESWLWIDDCLETGEFEGVIIIY